MKRYSQYIMYALFLLFGLGCDEGKIYPDETVDSGRTATVSLSFTGLKAWPKENMLSLCAFGEDKSKPLQTQRISKPAEDGKRLKLRLNNVTPDTRSIEVAVISRGLRLVYSYYTSPVDDSDEPLDFVCRRIGFSELQTYTSAGVRLELLHVMEEDRDWPVSWILGTMWLINL